MKGTLEPLIDSEFHSSTIYPSVSSSSNLDLFSGLTNLPFFALITLLKSLGSTLYDQAPRFCLTMLLLSYIKTSLNSLPFLLFSPTLIENKSDLKKTPG